MFNRETYESDAAMRALKLTIATLWKNQNYVDCKQ